MGRESQKNVLPTLFHFVRVRAAYQPHVNRYMKMVFNQCIVPNSLEFEENLKKIQKFL